MNSTDAKTRWPGLNDKHKQKFASNSNLDFLLAGGLKEAEQPKPIQKRAKPDENLINIFFSL